MGSTIDTILENNKNYLKILSENEFEREKIENANILFIAHETCIKNLK